MSSFSEISFVFFSVLESAVNRWLSLDSSATKKLSKLNNKSIDIIVTDLKLEMRILVCDAQLKLGNLKDGNPNTTIRTDLATLLNMAINKNQPTQLTGKLEISGEIDTGHAFKKILDQIDIDWEEQISHLSGDVVARQLTLAFQQFNRWATQLKRSTGRSLSEYVLEEKRLVAHPYEISQFLSTIDTIRNDVERLEARIVRLARE